MRPIDADTLKDKANDTDYMPTGKWLSLSDLDAALTIEPKRGKWINIISDPKHLVSEDFCSECGQIRRGYSSWHYCPNCGAKMEKDEEQML